MMLPHSIHQTWSSKRNDLELYLEADEQWPKTLEGLCSLIDSADDEAHGYCWVIPGFEAIGFTDQIGIEFKQAVLKQSGFNECEDFPKKHQGGDRPTGRGVLPGGRLCHQLIGV